ncbi:MAG: GDSL-type esterase/lipase family protein [Cyanobacteria bacterium J06635_10]
MNYTTHNALFLISIILNSLFLLFTFWFVSRKGGISYIKSIISIVRNKYSKGGWGVNSYYKDKKSQFEILPKSSDSIIFLGDSLTDQGEWVELLGNANIKNRGISGDTIGRILNRLDTIIQTKPKQIFIMVGINDLVNEKKSIEAVLEGYKTILSEFKTQSPNTQVFFQSVLPVNNDFVLFWLNNSNIIQLNLQLKSLAKQMNLQYIDLFSHLADDENRLDAKYTTDGLHLNGKGYLIWKEVVEKYVAVN